MCVGLVASSTEEMAARSIAYHAHGTPDGDKYRSVPLIRPPILYTTSSLKRGEGIYSNMQLVSNISPPPPPPQKKKKKKVLPNRYITECLFTLSNNYGNVFQDREYCSWTSRLQSFVVSLHRRRAASSMRGQ